MGHHYQELMTFMEREHRRLIVRRFQSRYGNLVKTGAETTECMLVETIEGEDV